MNDTTRLFRGRTHAHALIAPTLAPMRTANRLTSIRHPRVLGAMLLFFLGCSEAAETPSQRADIPPAAGTSGGPTASAAGAAEQHEEEHAPGDRVTLSEMAFRTAQIEVQPVVALTREAGVESLEVPGQVELDPRRVALMSSRIAGRLERLHVVEGDRVGAGQTVAALFSPEYLTAQADLAAAARRIESLAGTADEAGARLLAEAARRRLRLLGASDAEVARLAAGGEAASTLSLRAPISGSVIEAHLLTGAAVEAGAPVFTVADLTVIDVVAEVPERNLPQVSPGQRATVSIAAFPSLRFDGRVERLRDALNSETRTLQAVIHVPNASRRLRPGMFATVRLELPANTAANGERTSALTISESAVVTDGERRFVFVETGPRTYERREVRTSLLSTPGSTTQRSAMVSVHDGLRVGERVVVRGAFTLKSELAKATLGDEH